MQRPNGQNQRLSSWAINYRNSIGLRHRSDYLDIQMPFECQKSRKPLTDGNHDVIQKGFWVSHHFTISESLLGYELSRWYPQGNSGESLQDGHELQDRGLLSSFGQASSKQGLPGRSEQPGDGAWPGSRWTWCPGRATVPPPAQESVSQGDHLRHLTATCVQA